MFRHLLSILGINLFICILTSPIVFGRADTRFAKEEDRQEIALARRQALDVLLAPPHAKSSVLTIAKVRGFTSMIAKSQLEEFCDADIGGAIVVAEESLSYCRRRIVLGSYS